MTAPHERTVEVNGHACRIWEKGGESTDAPPVVYLAGLVGLPRWTPFLDRLAASRRVVAPSFPGFPGATGHDQLDTLLDWVAATLDLLEGAGVVGADLVGTSVGGALATEVAALAPGVARRLVLLAPLGLFDEREPVADPWAQPPGSLPALLAQDAQALGRLLARPDDADPVEWEIQNVRALEAGARLLWPLCDLGTHKRLHRVRVPTLVVWGSEDRLVPASTAKRYLDGLGGETTLRSIEGAGHLVDVDAPDAAAEAVLAFLR